MGCGENRFRGAGTGRLQRSEGSADALRVSAMLLNMKQKLAGGNAG